MTIQKQIAQFNQIFETLGYDLEQIEQERATLDGKYKSKENVIHSKWEAERIQWNREKEDVLKYYRIAKDSSSCDIVPGAAPQRPDIARLNWMIEQVDPLNRMDAAAGQIIDLCSSYLAYIERGFQQIKQREMNDILHSRKEREREEAELIQKRKDAINVYSQSLGRENITQLRRKFELICQDFEITPSYFSDWGKQGKQKTVMLLGFCQYDVKVPQQLAHVLESGLGRHFHKHTKRIDCPCGFTTDSSQEIFVEYNDRNEAELKSGIQALILNFIRYFPVRGFQVSIIDLVHFNANILGSLYVFSGNRHGFIDPVPTEESGWKQSMARLAAYYRKLEEKLGGQTVYEYNRRQVPGQKIPYRMLVINQPGERQQVMEGSEAAYLINNAAKFGITVLYLVRNPEGGSKGTEKEKKYPVKTQDYIRIISGLNGVFYIGKYSGDGMPAEVSWVPFQWLEMPAYLPDDFVGKVEAALKPMEKGTRYFGRYQFCMPKRSKGKRKGIQVPFAVNDEDQAISCSFDHELFAAYMMGAARSGKSTLLHTIISGLLMNYHPDEVELWLMDFKMTEFNRYVEHCPPHVKYVLLEKSEDLIFDIMDRLEQVMEDRQRVFSKNGWQKQADVPSNVYMPAIFVIIDEFAQMSQILKETKGSGYKSDYALKLTNLLQKGGALGFKFIFASQTYYDGVEGLTEPAKKQIQQRFALKNTYLEIKETLDLQSELVTPAIQHDMNSLPPYECMFKWRRADGTLQVERLRNMYTQDSEVDRVVDAVVQNMSAVQNPSSRDDVYVDKHPVLIDGNEPKTLKSQLDYYKAYEAGGILDEMEDSDILIYPGVPCSFKLAKPFVLIRRPRENIVLLGGNRECEVSVILSIFHSYARSKHPIRIWANERVPIYRKYQATLFRKYQKETDLNTICSQIARIKEDIRNGKDTGGMILVLGYEMIASDMELFEANSEVGQALLERPEDQMDFLKRVFAVSDAMERKRMQEEYNRRVEAYNAHQSAQAPTLYDARADMKWVVERASMYGIHFVFCFSQVRDFMDTRMDTGMFRHKLLFTMPRDDANSIGERKANEIEEDVCLYSNGKERFTMRPHIYKGVPRGEWQVDGQGNVIQKRG